MEQTTTHRGRRLGLALVCAAALLAGCGAQEYEPGAGNTAQEPTGTDTAAEEVTIVISDFTYDVPETVPAGAEVTVTNEDSVGHTVTSDEEGVFDVAVEPGSSVTFTAPDEPGEYGFHCIPHPHMTATLVVG